MKSLLILAVFMLLVHLISGSWFVKKCANTRGNCRKICKTGETKITPPSSRCPLTKLCCVTSDQIEHSCDSPNSNEAKLIQLRPPALKQSGLDLLTSSL
ncbi:PREDICTED: beta-defensin 126 [Elephantulus edwardii]|uniref:beta-defensin 126 n=1 Tax=Elephantulus edwardii TaxID=28737 RepID=UPI0003F0A505|nr:PREDICTED: beta-defensin 126 [Elephantulus edwardii]